MQKTAVKSQERACATQVARIIKIGCDTRHHQHRGSKSRQAFLSRACQC